MKLKTLLTLALIAACSTSEGVKPPPHLLRVRHGHPTPTPSATPTPTATPPPIVQTLAASNISSTTARLNGRVNPNGSSTTFHFAYGLTTGYGTNTAETGAGAGHSNQTKNATITGLTGGTDYHFRIVAVNPGGTATGADATFTTTATATPTPTPTATPSATPNVVTGAANSISATGATLNGLVNPLGSATTFQFNYGLTTGYGTLTPSTSAGSGTTLDEQSAAVTGLTPATLYHFRLQATNSGGSNNGDDKSFTTSPTPTPTPTPTVTPTPTPGPTPFPMFRGVVSLTSGAGNPPIIAAPVLNNADVVGVDFGGKWWDIQGVEGPLNAAAVALIDAQIARITAAGKLCVMRGLGGMGGSHSNGGNIPDWVYKAVGDANGVPLTGAAGEDTIYPGITYRSDDPWMGPVFWEPTYLAKKIAMIQLAGAHWASNDTIRVVAVQGAGIHTEDWNVPHGQTVVGPNTISEQARWLNSPTDPTHPGAGYTSAKLIAACEQLITATMNAFPRQIVTFNIAENGTVLDLAAAGGNPALAKAYCPKQITDWANATYPGRFEVQMSSMKSNTAPSGSDPDGSLKVIYDAALAGKYTAGQNAWFVINDSTFRMNGGSGTNVNNNVCPQYPNSTVTETEILEQACDKASSGTTCIPAGYKMRTLEIYEKDVTGLGTAVHYCAGVLATP